MDNILMQAQIPSLASGIASGSAQVSLSQSESKRRVLSCLTCRRRKVRCDRVYPACSRCLRAGEVCYYDEQRLPGAPRPASRSRSPKQMPSDRPWGAGGELNRVEREVGRYSARPVTAITQTPSSSSEQPLCHVAPMVKGNINGTASATSSGTSNRDADEYVEKRASSTKAASEAEAAEITSYRGKDFKTQYYGSTSPKSIIAHFPELRAFMETTVQHTSLPRVQGDLKALQVRWKSSKCKEYPLLDTDLVQFLPERNTVDHLVRLYFDTCETTFRIIHAPSFWKDYQAFWADTSAVNPAFVVLILLVMAAVGCASSKDPPTYIGDSSLSRERAVMWIDVSEKWLRRQSRKRTYLMIWQIRCLLLLAKQTNAVQKKQFWTAAGTLMREAMSAGFHRDLSRLDLIISPFDQEMKRRLWATIVELELQASVDRGMPSASASLPANSATVLNVHDNELTVDCDSLPASRPWHEYTACSYLHISRASFPLRVSLNTLNNDTSSPIPYKEVTGYEEMITLEIERLPKHTDPGKASTSSGMPPMVRTLLDVQLRQFLMLLHAPFARRKDSGMSSSPSIMVCFNTAASILDQHSQMCSSGNPLLLLLRQDYLSSALIMCHNMCNIICLQNNLFFTSISNTCVQYMETSLTLLGERITLLGTGHMQYWYMSAACAYLRTTMSPHETAIQRQRAVDRVLRQYYRVLTSQVDLVDAQQIIIPFQLNKVMSVGDTLQNSYYKNMVPDGSLDIMSQSTYDSTNLSLEEFYFGDPAAWTFEGLPLME